MARMTQDEGRAIVRAHLNASFGNTHNISDEGSGRTQLVSFVLRPAATGARHYVLEIHEDVLDGEELETQLAEAHVIDQFRNKGVRRLRIPPNGPAEYSSDTNKAHVGPAGAGPSPSRAGRVRRPRAHLDAAPDGHGGAAAGCRSGAMQQIRIVDDATRVQDATRIQDTENMRLALSDEPDQTWIARLRQLAAATTGAPALNLHVEGRTLVFACADRADLLERRRLIGQLIDQVNASGGSS